MESGITTKKESFRRAARQKKIRSLTDYLNSLPDRAHWIERQLLVLWEGISLCKEVLDSEARI